MSRAGVPARWSGVAVVINLALGNASAVPAKDIVIHAGHLIDGVSKEPQGVIVALVEPIFVASKSDLANMKGAAPVDQEVGKLIKVIDAVTLDDTGKIRNFSTGKVDGF